ncbi:MAG TPA: stage II sporulation protein R [Candidatus Scatovivens faecipullorum]|nr:stage II sporulation protein R [Candidatus Scatovivens faecipullorum]
MKKIKYFCILSILLFSFVFITISSYAISVSTDLSNNFFRLHILANSDSEEDQALKLKVRDNIIEYMETLTYDGLSKEEVVTLTQNHLDDFKKIAEETIKKEGFDYKVSLKIDNFYFPTKVYGNISLPAGYYDGLKIEIGEAKGQNWWCSLFPPLCFVDISSGVIDEETEKNLKNNLSEEDFAIITSDSETVKLKFKIVEMFSK